MSANYTKMCFEATEIQEAWTKSIGDAVYYEPAQDHICYVTNGRLADDRTGKAELLISLWNEWIHENKLTWLPRIEDLMEMVTIGAIEPYLKYDIAPGHNIIRAMHEWSVSQKSIYWEVIEDMSPTELWLCFMMDVRYNKSWNGKTWEEIK